ncbi:MAG: Wzz/FepE/Etk N-terminal domain-containing protein [Candidatus Aminicenantia bacterium]
MAEEEIELIDYFRVIWKRKWIIIIGTLLCIIVAGVVSFILKPIYEIDAIIQPGKFMVQNQAGNFEEIVLEKPQQIADKVKHKSYNALIALELKIDEKEIPEIKAENIKNTLLTRMWIRNHDIELSKKILNLLIKFIKYDIDKKIDIEIKNIDTSIKWNEIEKGRRNKEITILKNKLKIIEQRKKDIIREMESTKNRIDELEKEQLRVLKKDNRSETESLGMLLYSNEIQQSLRYYDILNEKLSKEKIEEEDVNSQIKKEEARINQIDNEIENLKERKGRIDYTKIVKEPTSSIYPVSPKKKLNVLIAGILGLMIFTILSFFLEYIEKQKVKDWKDKT